MPPARMPRLREALGLVVGVLGLGGVRVEGVVWVEVDGGGLGLGCGEHGASREAAWYTERESGGGKNRGG